MSKVLLIEDDESNRITLSVLLEDEGFDIVEAGSCAEAREKLALSSAAYDLILTDLHLGDGLGTDLVSEMRARFPCAKIVLISGSAGPANMPTTLDGLVPKGTEFSAALRLLRGIIAS